MARDGWCESYCVILIEREHHAHVSKYSKYFKTANGTGLRIRQQTLKQYTSLPSDLALHLCCRFTAYNIVYYASTICSHQTLCFRPGIWSRIPVPVLENGLTQCSSLAAFSVRGRTSSDGFPSRLALPRKDITESPRTEAMVPRAVVYRVLSTISTHNQLTNIYAYCVGADVLVAGKHGANLSCKPSARRC